MAFENMDEIEPDVEEAGPPPEEANNRTFLIVAGVLGGIMLLSLLFLAGFALLRFPDVQRQRNTAEAEAMILGTEAAIAVRQTTEARVLTRTPTPTNTPTVTPLPPTPTLVVAQPASPTPTFGPDPRTATVAALLTQAAAAQQITPTPTVAVTQLPDGGFFDDVGAPGLMALALLLVGVIFAARRLRTA
jgi:uncharacterized protein (TIGR03382 family)